MPVYTYDQLSAICGGFSDRAPVGSGGFGNVYRGELNFTPVAVKVCALLSLCTLMDDSMLAQLLKQSRRIHDGRGSNLVMPMQLSYSSTVSALSE